MHRELFEQYRNINLSIIKVLKDEEEDTELFDKRGEIIKEILSIRLDNDTFLKYYKEMNLDILDLEIEETLKDNLHKLKMKIQKTKMVSKANRGYAACSRQENFFSKKV